MKRKLGQFFNLQAVRLNFKSVLRPQLFIPVLSIKDISELRWEALAQSGIECIVFDKDNTLTAPYSEQIHQQVALSLQECKACILSNTAGSPDDKDFKLGNRLEEKFGIPVIRHQFRKPRVREEIHKHFLQQTGQQFNPKKIAVIGDRICVDVLLANLGGFVPIQTYGLEFSPENMMVKGARIVQKLITQKDLIGGRMTQVQAEMAIKLMKHHVLKGKRNK